MTDAVFMMPEIVLTIAASLLLLAPVTGFRESEWSAKWVTLVILAITGGSIVACSWAVPDMTASPMLNAMFALDAFSIFFKLLFVVVIALIVLLSDDFLAESRYSPWEYYSLLCFALLGMMCAVGWEKALGDDDELRWWEARVAEGAALL